MKTIIEGALLGSIECVSLIEIPSRKQALRISWETEGAEVKIVIVNPLEKHVETPHPRHWFNYLCGCPSL